MNPHASRNVLEEHRFWLKLLEDHAQFLLERLAPDECNWRSRAARYAGGFAALLSQLDGLPAPPAAGSAAWIGFAKEAHPWAAGYYQLEGHLQSSLLAGGVGLRLPPVFLNGTMNENQEYLRLLKYYVQGADAPALPLWDLMELWLEDQLGHAGLVRELAGEEEPGLAQEAAAAQEALSAHLLRNRYIYGYLRFSPPGFPLQLEAAQAAADCVERFIQSLWDAVKTLSGAKPSLSFLLRFLEHQILEGTYFLDQLSPWLAQDPVRPSSPPSGPRNTSE
ncbi:DUF2935 domain-containing protein [Gorillibacterium sp. sgz5001074]|uniref:DUF2935 domain-containing protein n=1 Tax=Gorillibacterium sp. sgz5001074 TaxID=3446695 RepID=UPI003F664E43